MVGGLGGWAVGGLGADDPRPHVLLILVDDMGYGDLRSYNPDSQIPTPHLDRLATDGMRFTDAHAAGPLCHPSRYGLMTGQLPFRVNTHKWPAQRLIADDRTTIASLLDAQGYRTAMVGKWHLGFDENGYDRPLPGGPVDVGFDSFFGIRASTDIPPYFYIRDDRALLPPDEAIEANQSGPPWNRIQGAFWRAGGISSDLDLEDVLPRFTDEAVSVIETHAADPTADPLFLYLAYPAPHTPWLPTAEFRGRTNNLFGDFTVMVDHMVGRVLEALAAAGLAEDTLVIFSSDNGPVWYAKDVAAFGHDAVGGLRGMKGDAYEGGHRMPFIVRWPGEVAAGSVSDRLICFTDVFATLAELTGYPLSDRDGPDSFSFLPTLRGESHPARGPLLLESAKGHRVLRDGRWKYIDGPGSGGFSDGFGDRYRPPAPRAGEPSGQLYDLLADPAEITNLWRDRPEVVRWMRSALAQVSSGERTR